MKEIITLTLPRRFGKLITDGLTDRIVIRKHHKHIIIQIQDNEDCDSWENDVSMDLR